MNKKPIINTSDNFTLGFLIDMNEKAVRKIQFLDVIASGGSCIVYSCYDESQNRFVVLKEYFPDEANSIVPYYRDAEHCPVCIDCNDEVKVQKELEMQEICVSREMDINERLMKLPHNTNSADFFNARRLIPKNAEYGKYTSYIVIDTNEGETLQHKLRVKGRFSVAEAVELVKKSLVVVSTMQDAGCTHGDLSLSNIFLSGANDANSSIKFLDFGSAFFHSDFLLKEDATNSDILDLAKRITTNITIGSSHEHIRTKLATNLDQVRQRFLNISSVRNAKALIEAFHQMDLRVDLYALVINFFQLITGRQYDVLPSKKELTEMYYSDSSKINESFIDKLHEILEKNGNLEYTKIEDLKHHLEVLAKIERLEICPESLLFKIKHKKMDIEYDEKLLAPITVTRFTKTE